MFKVQRHDEMSGKGDWAGEKKKREEGEREGGRKERREKGKKEKGP
jgi:hypothetical protein